MIKKIERWESDDQKEKGAGDNRRETWRKDTDRGREIKRQRKGGFKKWGERKWD